MNQLARPHLKVSFRRTVLALAAAAELACATQAVPPTLSPRRAVRSPAPSVTTSAAPEVAPEAAIEFPPPLATVAASTVEPTAPAPVSDARPLGEKLPIFLKAQYYIREWHLRGHLLDPRRALVMALGAGQYVTPELFVTHSPADDPKQVTVTVGDARHSFSIAHVDNPFRLAVTLAEILTFVRAHLPPLPALQQQQRELRLASAMTNGMLRVLDTGSTLLPPAEFAAMQVGGPAAGAVGLVIRRDDEGHVVVGHAVPEGSAAKAGIRDGDRIMSIDRRDARPLDLDEVVEALRGPVGTKVDIAIARPDMTRPEHVVVARVAIQAQAYDPPSVVEVPGLVPGRPVPVGYLRLRAFNVHSTQTVTEALTLFKTKKVGGMILDLRGNQGGLFDQAHKVADRFIKSGTIVSMESRREDRKDMVAVDDGDEPAVPLAVLVDGRSGAAAEIVAAAVKELDRGILIGRRTPGNDNVQMLFGIPSPYPSPAGAPNEFALKLTTGRWRTAAGNAIGGVGVAPDIEEGGVCVRPGDSDLVFFETCAGAREVDRADHWRAPDPATPSDFVAHVAMALLARAKGPDRQGLLAEAKKDVAQVRALAEGNLAATLSKRGVNWGPGPAKAQAGRADLALELRPGARSVVNVRVKITNTGKASLHRVRIPVESTYWPYQIGELAVGALSASEARAYDVMLPVPGDMSAPARLRASVLADGPVLAKTAEVAARAEDRPIPALSYRYEVTDGPAGAGRRGRVLRVDLKNAGAGPAGRVTARLHGPFRQRGVVVTSGVAKATEVPPGTTKRLSFEYEVDPGVLDPEPYIKLSVTDWASGSSITRTIYLGNDGRAAASGWAAPPSVTLTAPAATDASLVRVSGAASDDEQIRDLFIEVSSPEERHAFPLKVFYAHNRGNPHRLPFSVDVPVAPGTNLVRVIARDRNHTAQAFAYVLRREASAKVSGSGLPEPGGQSSTKPQVGAVPDPGHMSVGPDQHR